MKWNKESQECQVRDGMVCFFAYFGSGFLEREGSDRFGRNCPELSVYGGGRDFFARLIHSGL